MQSRLPAASLCSQPLERRCSSSPGLTAGRIQGTDVSGRKDRLSRRSHHFALPLGHRMRCHHD